MFSSKKYNTGNKIEIESLHFKYKITYQILKTRLQGTASLKTTFSGDVFYPTPPLDISIFRTIQNKHTCSKHPL